MIFQLITLVYSLTALQPVISEQTMQFHYGKHLQAYVNNLNALKEGTEFENSDLKTIIQNADGALFNNAAQVYNHEFYFEQFAQQAQLIPEGGLLKAINNDFGSFEIFKAEFSKAAATIFGSGWAWLSINKGGKLVITKESNAVNPLVSGDVPLLTIDVWEHAYYLDYQNRRKDYIKALWSIIDWKVIEKRYEQRDSK